MGEGNIISSSDAPRTRESIAMALRELGLEKGMTVLVHSSLSSLGWVCGGPVAVVQALMDIITDEGTIVMPTHSGNYSDPAKWENPPVPKEWVSTIKEQMPAFDPRWTPTYFMGQIVEVFRTFPRVQRSYHPTVSFAAWGKHAEQILTNHELAYALGENSPLARMYELDGKVLLLGVGYDSNTSFHLSEYRAQGAKIAAYGSPIMENGERVWKTYEDIEYDVDIFEAIGKSFDESDHVVIGKVGSTQTRLFSQRAAVDFAIGYIEKHRQSFVQS